MFSNILILNQHVVLLLTLMNAQYLSVQCFLTTVITILLLLKKANRMKILAMILHIIFSQNELNDLVRELNLSNFSAELLASRLKQKTFCLMAHASLFIATGNKNSSIFSLKKSIWCTAQILFTFCRSLECHIMNLEIGDYSSTAARDH